jgi:hypothetical protein
MLCAHAVRRLKPGTFDEFKAGFMPDRDDAPSGWVRFHMLRGLADPDEVVTFGFFRERSRISRAVRPRATSRSAAMRSLRTSRP